MAPDNLNEDDTCIIWKAWMGGESKSATLQYHHAGLSPSRVKMEEAATQYESLPFPRGLNV